MVKLLCLADMHSSNWALERLEKRKKDYDGLVLAGDIAESEEFAKRVMEVIDEVVGRENAFYVPGNMDRAVDVFSPINVHGKVISFKGVKIAGFGYSSPTPFGTPGELSEDEIREGLIALDVDSDTLLITHAPPKGILDNDFGSEAIREFVDAKKPKAHVFGHIHEVSGAFQSDTLFVNLPPAIRGKAGMLEINEDARVQFVEL